MEHLGLAVPLGHLAHLERVGLAIVMAYDLKLRPSCAPGREAPPALRQLGCHLPSHPLNLSVTARRFWAQYSWFQTTAPFVGSVGELMAPLKVLGSFA